MVSTKWAHVHKIIIELVQLKYHYIYYTTNDIAQGASGVSYGGD